MGKGRLSLCLKSDYGRAHLSLVAIYLIRFLDIQSSLLPFGLLRYSLYFHRHDSDANSLSVVAMAADAKRRSVTAASRAEDAHACIANASS